MRPAPRTQNPTSFIRKALSKCIASSEDLEAAKEHGRTHLFEGPDGSITAYVQAGKIYVASMTIYPETVTRSTKPTHP